MALLGQLLNNAFSDTPQDYNTLIGNSLQNRLNQAVSSNNPNMDYLVNPNQAPTAATAQYQPMSAVPGMGQSTGTGLTFNQPATGPVAPAMLPPATQTQPQTQTQAQPQAPAQPQMMPAVYTPPSTGAPQPIINDQGQTVGQETPAQMVAGAQTNAPVAQAPAAPVNPNQPAMTPTAATAQAPANPQAQPEQPPAPDWSLRLQTAGSDPMNYHAIAGDKTAPEDIRKAASEKAFELADRQKKAQEAEDKIKKAFVDGDQQTQNQVMRDIRKDDASGSYVKAYLYHRLGLHELGKNEEQKLGVNQFNQAIVDGTHYTVEKNGQGAVTRAWDAAGKPADDSMLSRINATATPLGTHQYNYGAEVYKTPTGDLVRNRTNSITGASEWVDTKTNQPWKGEGQPVPLRVETQTEIAQNKANIGVNAAGARAYNAAGGRFNFQNQTNLPLQGGATTAGIVRPGAQPAPAVPGAQPAPAVRPAVQTTPAGQPAPNVTNQPAPANVNADGTPMTPAQIEQRNKAQAKVGATAATAVANLGSTKNSIDQADHALDILESGKHNIGPVLSGAPLAQAVGTQFETESARNTKAVMDAVRSIGGAASQAAIKGHLSNQELTFLTENKPTERSDPEYTRQWLTQARDKLARAANEAQRQVSTGGTHTENLPTRGEKKSAEAPRATKRYNKETGQLEDIR